MQANEAKVCMSTTWLRGLCLGTHTHRWRETDGDSQTDERDRQIDKETPSHIFKVT